MAIEGIGSFSNSSNPLEMAASSLGGSSGGSSLGAMAGMGAAMYSNPYTAIAAVVMQALSAPKIDISQAQASGQAVSGAANFGGETAVKFNKPMIDLSEPLHVAVVGVVLVGAIYVFKRFL